MQKIIIFLLLFVTYTNTKAQNRIACYPLDSAIVRDNITGSTGFTSAGVSWCPDRFGNPRGAMRIDKNRYSAVNLGNGAHLKPVIGTVSLWVKMYSAGGSGNNSGALPPILAPYKDNGDYEGYGFYYEWLYNKFYPTTMSTTANLSTTANNTGQLLTWYHLVLTFTDDIAKFYIDGVLIGTASKTPNIYTPTATVFMGYRPEDGGGFANIAVDDLQIFDYVLSATEVQALYNNTSGCETVVGTENTTNSNDLVKVFPNPTTGEIHFTTNAAAIKTYTVVDAAGRLLQQGSTAGSETISLSSLENGIYFLMLENVSGQRTQHKIVLIQ